MAARAGRDVQVVRDRDEGGVGLGRDLVEQGHHGRAGVDVEGAGRLVGEDQHRAAYERAGDRDTLLLPAGEPVGDLVDAVPESDALQHVGGDAAAVPEQPSARVAERHHDVVQRGATGQQVELLEHEAHVLTRRRSRRPERIRRTSRPSNDTVPDVGHRACRGC